MPQLEAHWEAGLLDAHACPLPHCTNWVDEPPAQHTWGSRGHIVLSAMGPHSNRSVCEACGSKYGYDLFWSLHHLHLLRRRFDEHQEAIVREAADRMDGGPQTGGHVSRAQIDAANAYLTEQLS